MTYTAIRVNIDRTLEEVELEYERNVYIDGNSAYPISGCSHRFLIVYSVIGTPQVKANLNKIASAFYGAKLYGTCIIVNSNLEENLNDNYMHHNYQHDSDDSDNSDEEREDEGDEQYTTTRVSLDIKTFKYMCRHIGIKYID